MIQTNGELHFYHLLCYFRCFSFLSESIGCVANINILSPKKWMVTTYIWEMEYYTLDILLSEVLGMYDIPL